MSATATRQHRAIIERARDRDEPTRTRTLRKRYRQNLRGRWAAIMAALRTAIVENDVFGLRREGLVGPPRGFDFDRDADKERAFARWLERTTERELLQQFGQDNQYITRAYERGLEDAATELNALGGIDDIGTTTVRLPVHRDQLEALYTRNLNALEGMTDATATQMRRELAEGLAGGDSPTVIKDRLADRVDKIGKTRAETIARTEIQHSHNRARATEYERTGVEQVDIVIANDACSECQALKAGAPYPVSEAGGILPHHPNCRCALVIHTTDT